MYLSDLFLWNFSFYFTFIIIYDTFNFFKFNELFFLGLVLINVCFTVVFIGFSMYSKIWRYADVADFFSEWIACLVANTAFYIINLIFSLNFGIRIPLIMLLLSTFFLFMFRFFYRYVIMVKKLSRLKKPSRKRLLIVGAGEAASILLRELSNNPYNEYHPVCIVDDDPAKKGRSMFGVKVAGTTEEIPALCKKYKIDTIIFAILTLSGKQKKQIVDICNQTKAELKVIPSIYNSMTGDVKLSSAIRDVEVEDLLGRDPVVLDVKGCRDYVEGKNVLVTGGGGSIGSELCRQIVKLNPKNLIILDIYENNAYNIEQELKRNYGDKVNFEVQIASVRDYDKLDMLFREKEINLVFHAAAHKHVPLMETTPEEAVKNNVFGTLNAIRLADKYKVERFVLISTDKAVNPTNIMGATKRLCEMLVQTMNNKSNTEYVAVRFGNVLGSNGSVIPLFKQQISEGGPITVTHPDIIRYFMTIPEAVSLVLTAGAMAKGGEIFILDMGEPVKINDLAMNLIRLSGLEYGTDIEIKYTGLRPGEKLYEELLMGEEGVEKTKNEKIAIGQPIKLDEDLFWNRLDQLYKAGYDNDKDLIETLLNDMVPTFRHNKG